MGISKKSTTRLKAAQTVSVSRVCPATRSRMERARNPEQKAMRREKNQRRRRRSRESTEKQSSGHFPPTCCTTTSDGQFFNRSTQVRQSKPNERFLDILAISISVIKLDCLESHYSILQSIKIIKRKLRKLHSLRSNNCTVKWINLTYSC